MTPSPFWSSPGRYPAAYYYMFQESREPIVLTGTTAKALKYPGVGTVSNIEVWNAPSGGIKYKRDDDYIVGLNAQGFTTIARSGSLPGTNPQRQPRSTSPTGGRAPARGGGDTRSPAARGVLPLVGVLPLPDAIGRDRRHLHLHWEETGTVEPTRALRVPRRRIVEVRAARDLRREHRRASLVVPATLWFQFFDMTAGAGGLHNGQGPAIDDLRSPASSTGP